MEAWEDPLGSKSVLIGWRFDRWVNKYFHRGRNKNLGEVGPHAGRPDAARSDDDDGARDQRTMQPNRESLTSHPITVQSVMFDAAVVFYAATSKRCAPRGSLTHVYGV